MVDWLHGQKHVEHCLTCTQPGHVDALAMWFDLHLDDVTTLSSVPDDVNDRDGVHRADCWDQAIFPVQSPIHVTAGQTLNISISCHGGRISVDICDQHRSGDICTISKLQDAFSSSQISTMQNDSQLSEQFPNDDQKSLKNFSTTADSDGECSKNLPLNISTNWKRKTSHFDHTAHWKVLPNASASENEKEKGTELKNTQKKYEMALKKTELIMLDNDILKSGSCSKTMLHKVPESDISDGITRRLDCNAVASEEVVRFLNDVQWMEALKKTAMLLRQQVRSFAYCVNSLTMKFSHILLTFIVRAFKFP
jgi:hypothetical protein